MHTAPLSHPQLYQLLFALMIAIILPFRLRRMMRARELKPAQLWIVPIIFLALGSLQFFALPPQGMGWGYCFIALLVGGALGWQRGSMMHIEVHPETGTLMQKGSMAALISFLAIFLIRMALRSAAEFHLGGLNLDMNLVSDLLMAFIVGLFVVMRIEMFLRARRLLEEARAGRAA